MPQVEGGRLKVVSHEHEHGTLGTLYPTVHTYLSWDLGDSGSWNVYSWDLGNSRLWDLGDSGSWNLYLSWDLGNTGSWNVYLTWDLGNPGSWNVYFTWDLGNPGSWNVYLTRDLGNPGSLNVYLMRDLEDLGPWFFVMAHVWSWGQCTFFLITFYWNEIETWGRF